MNKPTGKLNAMHSLQLGAKLAAHTEEELGTYIEAMQKEVQSEENKRIALEKAEAKRLRKKQRNLRDFARSQLSKQV